MLDFFRIVSVETAGTNQVIAVHHVGYVFVLIEVILALAVVIVACVAAAVLPSISALGGVSAFLKKRQLSAPVQRYSSVSDDSPRAAAVEPGAAKPVDAAPAVPAEPTRIPPTPAFENLEEVKELRTPASVAPASPQKASSVAPPVDLDAVFDEFRDEETLMDEAFVSSIIAPTTEKVAAPIIQKPVATKQADLSPSAPSREESELAKKMMRGFAARDERTKGNVASKAAESVDKAPKRYEDAAAPVAPDVVKKVAAPAAVDLDAVFDELETTEEALSDALLDTIVSSM
jgi:hypothetical protein